MIPTWRRETNEHDSGFSMGHYGDRKKKVHFSNAGEKEPSSGHSTSDKNLLRNEVEIKTFSDERELKDLVDNRPTLNG